METFVDIVPMCENGGPLYTITTTSNLVEHETVFDDGRVHATFTKTGTFSAVPLENPSLPSYTGSSRLGELQPERDDGQRHLHLQPERGGLGRIDDQQPQNDDFNARPDGW